MSRTGAIRVVREARVSLSLSLSKLACGRVPGENDLVNVIVAHKLVPELRSQQTIIHHNHLVGPIVLVVLEMPSVSFSTGGQIHALVHQAEFSDIHFVLEDPQVALALSLLSRSLNSLKNPFGELDRL